MQSILLIILLVVLNTFNIQNTRSIHNSLNSLKEQETEPWFRTAQEDIDSNTIRIFIPCGYGCGFDFPTSYDSAYQQKYNLTFVTQGCLRFIDEDEYHTVIFKHLDSLYQDTWRIEMREEIKVSVGLGD